jgi:hypothetical protein
MSAFVRQDRTHAPQQMTRIGAYWITSSRPSRIAVSGSMPIASGDLEVNYRLCAAE